MFDRVLIMLLDYLSRFGVALRGIHRKVWYMPLTDYSIHSKRRIFPLLWSNAWKYNIQTKKRLTKVKEKWRTMQFDIFDLSFIFYIPVSQTVSLIKRSGTCYFLHVSNYWWVCWCYAHTITCIKQNWLAWACDCTPFLVKPGLWHGKSDYGSIFFATMF